MSKLSKEPFSSCNITLGYLLTVYLPESKMAETIDDVGEEEGVVGEGIPQRGHDEGGEG